MCGDKEDEVGSMDRLAFGLFKRAYDDAVRAPCNAKAHERFEKWAKLVSRIVGLPIEACHATDGPGRARWVRATAAALVAVMMTHYGASVWLNPRKPESPAPPRAAIGQLMVVAASTDTGPPSYFWNTVTGQQFQGLPPLPRRPTTTIRDT
jgi:hypothetical protein